MKMQTKWICVASGVLAILAMGVGAAAGEPIAAPHYVAGDSWTFRRLNGTEYTKTVTEVASDGSYVIAHSTFPGVKFRFDQNLAVKEIEGDFPLDRRSFVGWKYIEFPMTLGKKFSYRVEGSRGPFKIDSVTSADWVTIQVPAGTFKALEIESCWTNEAAGWYGCGMKYWYVPTLKEFVRRETPAGWLQALRDGDFQLVSTNLKPVESAVK